MKIPEVVVTLVLASSVAAVYAASKSACVEACNQTLKSDIAICGYPEKDNPQLYRDCLKTARDKFASCKNACTGE